MAKMAVARALARWAAVRSSAPTRTKSPRGTPDPGAIVVGYGPVGQTVTRLLAEFGINPIIVETNVDAVLELQQRGQQALFGDATRPEILKAAEARLRSLSRRDRSAGRDQLAHHPGRARSGACDPRPGARGIHQPSRSFRPGRRRDHSLRRSRIRRRPRGSAACKTSTFPRIGSTRSSPASATNSLPLGRGERLRAEPDGAR